MTIDEIHVAAVKLEKEIEDAPPGAPELAAIATRIGELQNELERARSVQGALVPDSSSPRSADEVSGDYLVDTLRNLLNAASSKR
jgi:hypothetical protein